MDEWFTIVVRQLILYSLPVLVSITLVTMLEARVMKSGLPHPFYAISWRGFWMPFITALCFHRGVIIALPHPLTDGLKPAATRLLAHGLLCSIGFLLYSWSLAYQAPVGLPPLHLWWAKVLMFFNLCMLFLHLLPLPLLLMGEIMTKSPKLPALPGGNSLTWIGLTLLVATPLLDLSLGSFIIYPVYEWLSSSAIQLAG
ncbi:hypothetical protein F3F96_05225 [Mariprofundus sp. NF]|uniref:hypothetical protein n=1 Tax=Mariprofundus sp. NF TaxID=2608716 RepID=UPI0015A0D042|nr:hypothetical protein [Mariprofundus sp. NF]NWF38528.1 hypothetical protein [Mariprofundus sp. NF]